MKTRRVGLIVLALLSVGVFYGCRGPRIEPPGTKIAVLNFDLTQDVDVNKELKGWWFTSRDVYYNQNAGEIIADIFADTIRNQCPFADVYSRTDYKYYLVSKREILKRELPDLNDDKIDQIIHELDPVDIGRDLGMDKVVVGAVFDTYTTHHRTVHWWSSVVDAEVKIIDVATGKIEWQSRMDERNICLSWYSTANTLARKMIKLMNKQLFYRA